MPLPSTHAHVNSSCRVDHEDGMGKDQSSGAGGDSFFPKHLLLSSEYVCGTVHGPALPGDPESQIYDDWAGELAYLDNPFDDADEGGFPADDEEAAVDYDECGPASESDDDSETQSITVQLDNEEALACAPLGELEDGIDLLPVLAAKEGMFTSMILMS